jgi:type III restriction enzyme
MELKRYQQAALDALKDFLAQCREGSDPKGSFEAVTAALPLGQYESDYRPLAGLEAVPYCCVRIPTGGGKTILGAHTVKLAATHFLERDFPVVLWLVPSNTIRTQTVEALKNPAHPYRQVLDDAFDGRVRVFDITDFEQIRPADMAQSACLVVGTIQTLRVSNTDGRKVYAHNENLEPHFGRMGGGEMAGMEQSEGGQVKFSFANLLHYHQPLLIVDEAHNAVTGLSGEMQQRINPAAIIEFTATPRARNNVLFSVSATELKEAQMIKLPVVLTAHTSWQAAVAGALAERAHLAETARGETPYIRPLVLFQAQNRDQEVHAEVLRQHLIENEQIAAERIAVVTGEQRELDGLNLFDPKCPIEYVITVQALKEGWDCSFAYVFCSLANIHSKTDVEQLLGRVLRMPYAMRRQHPAMNRAYAHLCEPNFISAADSLKDRLIDMGFASEEAEDNIELGELPLSGGGDAPLPPSLEVSFELEGGSGFDALPPPLQGLVTMEANDRGTTTIKIERPLDIEQEQQLIALLPVAQQERVSRQLTLQRYQSERLQTPAANGLPFSVPQLCLTIQGELELAEPELFSTLGGWDINSFTAALSSSEFSTDERNESFELDVEAGKVTSSHIAEPQRQYQLNGLDTAWDEKVLARFIDKQCRQRDISQTQLLEFARRIIEQQLNRGLSLERLVLAKYRLAKAVARKIAEYRIEAESRNFQHYLFEGDDSVHVEASLDFSFDFHPSHYPANSFYRGTYRFNKHYYGPQRVGDLKSKGEEFDCARAIDMQEQVAYWVRNLERKEGASFRLPLAHGWFYPDFVAKLKDGRVLVIEYKGAHLEEMAETREKENIGQLWAAQSGGKGLFLMAVKSDQAGRSAAQQIESAIKS